MKIKIIHAPLLLLFLASDSQAVDVSMSTNEGLQTPSEIMDKKKSTVDTLKGEGVQINNLAKAASVKKSSLLFEDSFEEDLIPGKYWDYSGNTSIERRKGLTADGQYSLCFKLDHQKSVVPERTELRLRKKIVEFILGNEYWVGISIYIPENWVFDASSESLFQWHGLPDKDLGEGWRNPVLTLRTLDQEWVIDSRWDRKELTPHMGTAGYLYSGRKNYKVGKIVPKIWTNWVFHIKWSYLDDGILEVWKDSDKVVEQHGGNTFNDGNGPYLKFGIYKWDWKKKSKTVTDKKEVCFDSLRIAGEDGSYEMVHP